jgi:ubiquitin-conjugating enzyme E2 L3
VLPELVRIINNPELDHPIRGDLAEQYKTDRAAFNKAALEHIKKNASD